MSIEVTCFSLSCLRVLSTLMQQCLISKYVQAELKLPSAEKEQTLNSNRIHDVITDFQF